MNNTELVEEQFKNNDSLKNRSFDNTKLLGLSVITTPLLSGLSPEIVNYLMVKSKFIRYQKQTIIVSEGRLNNSFFIVYSGKVRIFSSADSKEITHSIVGPGTYFGETSLLTNEPLSSSVMTLEKTVCAVIAKEDFLNWLVEYPEVTFYFLGALSGIIRHLTDRIKQLALLNVYERIVKTLLDMAVDEGNIRIIYNKPTQQELAFMVGASREMVCKIMLDLTKGGYVKAHDDYIIISKKIPSCW